MPGSTDRFVVSDRPAPTLTDRYRPLPDGMNNSHITVVPAHQIAAGDVIVAFFTDGPGTRHAEHVEEAFTADPPRTAAAPCRHDARSARTPAPTASERTGTSVWPLPTTAPSAPSLSATRRSPSSPPTGQPSSRPWTAPPPCRTCSPWTITSDPRMRTEPGRPGHLIERGRDGRYLIGGLWPWHEWPVEDGDSDD